MALRLSVDRRPVWKGLPALGTVDTCKLVAELAAVLQRILMFNFDPADLTLHEVNAEICA